MTVKTEGPEMNLNLESETGTKSESATAPKVVGGHGRHGSRNSRLKRAETRKANACLLKEKKKK